jgi:transcriptional regulator with XRE-family HTH domain
MSSPLGDKIRAARKAKKLSLESLAALVGSSKSYMWELENRENANPGAEVLSRIASALDVTTEHLLSRSPDTPEEEVADLAFFRKYQQLPPDAKKQLRKILKTWDE